MKTIFIPISARQPARNVLRTDILKTLQAEHATRVVIFAPSFKIPHYVAECAAPNTLFEGVDIPREPISKLDTFFHRLSLFYINSRTGRFTRKQYFLYELRQPNLYAVSLSLLFLFGGSRLLRTISRFLDLRLVRDERLARFFDAYKPDLVFTPKITSSLDRSFLRQAKKRGIKTVGMISAWDNITLAKYPFRIIPDKLIVYNEIIKGEAVKYLNVSEKDIYISGWPPFDHYVNTKRTSREEFGKKLGIDPRKKIILFVSNGTAGTTEWQVLALLDRAIKSGEIKEDVTILVRHHPAQDMLRGDVKYSGNIVFDNSKTVFEKTGETFSEILTQDTDHLADTLFHSDVTINTCSTMSIDAAIYDKPIINLAFDGWEKKPFYKSIASFYTPNHTHYQPIVKSGGVRIAYSFAELLRFINLYLENPRLEAAGRKKIVEEQCWKLDGQAGKRIGNFLLSELN